MGQIAGFECFISLVNIHIILTKLFSGRFNKKNALICFLSLFLPNIIFSYFYPNTVWGYLSGSLFTILIFLVPLFTIKNIQKSQSIYISLFYFGASNAFIISSIWIARSLQLSEFTLIVIDVIFQCVFLILCLLILKNIVFLGFFRQMEFLPRYLKIVLLFFILGSVSLAYFLSSFFYDYPHSTRMSVIQILTALLIILVGLLWPILITSSMSSLNYKNIVNTVEQQMDEQVKRYEQSIKTNTEIRSFRHDFKNLKLGLASFLKAEDNKGALQYLAEAETPLVPEYIVFETGSPVADALLSEKSVAAESINAKIVFEGVIPGNLVSNTDICIILGNSLDNALEACAKIPADEDKTILVSSCLNNGFLFLVIQNPVVRDVVITNNSIVTTKQNKEMHGIGLYSITHAIKKYDGELTLSCENKLFSLKIVLDLNSRG